MLPDVIGGRYRLERELGRGGMGVVHLAREEGREEPIALKVLLTREFSESALRHFEQEFRTLTTLAHPNLTEVYDFGRVARDGDERQVPFFTMEFVDGEPLDRWLARDGLDLARLFPILSQVGQALAYLHGRGLVHQDVKPSNILVAGAADGAGTPRVKLMDLGLAGGPREGTGPGRIRGTVAYLPPEAARGGLVDPRSDLYSLGCVIYELVTGRPPFQGTTALSVLRGHLQEPPLPPTSLNRDLPEPFEALILRLLEKDPGLRPAGADRFLHLLNEVAGGTLAIETPEVRRHRVLGGGFVGRTRELDRLHALAREAREAGGRMVFLVGESGVGKSCLLREFQVRCQLDGFDLFPGRAADGRSALVDALGHTVRARGPLSEETRRVHGAALDAWLGSAHPTRDAVAEPERGAAAERFRLPGAVLAALRELAAQQPFGLALDDLHAADETTCTLLRHLARELGSADADPLPVMILGAYRGDEVRRASAAFELLAEARREEGFEELFLDPLGPEETAALVRASCGAEEVPEAFLTRILEETRGNPLHVAELLALLAEEGHLRPGAEDPFDPEALAVVELPRKIRDLIERRLARVEPEPRLVLQAGAVLGEPTLSADGIAAITGKRWEHVARQLLELTQHGLVLREEDEAGAPVYRVAHPGLAALAREQTPADESRTLHARAVSYLERRGIPRNHAAWDSFAAHAEAAGQPGRAIEAYARAGDLARELHANREAIAAYGGAIDLSRRQGSPSAVVLCGLYHRRGETHALIGDEQRAEEDYRWMLARAEKEQSDELKANAHLALGGLLARRARYPEAQENLELTLEIAGRRDDPARCAEARMGLGAIAARLGRFDEGVEQFERARENARRSEREDLDLQALLAEGALYREQGDYKRSLACFEEAAKRTAGRAEPAIEETIQEGAALALEVQGEHARALEAYGAARARAEERGDVRAVASLADRLGALQLEMGDPSAAAREFERALELHRKLGSREGVVVDLQNLAGLHLYGGRLETARETAEEALGLARRVGTRDLVATSWSLLGRIHLRLGDLRRAAADLDEARGLMRDIRNLRWLAAFLVDLGDLRLREHATEEARKQYQESAFLARKIGDRRLESIATCRLGEAHLEDRDYDRALVACRKARQLVEGTGLVREQADARLLHGRIELARPGGDVVSAEMDALEALEAYRRAREPERLWQAEHLAGRAEARLARRAEAAERIDRAHRYLESVRSRLTERYRDMFLGDSRRAEVYEDRERLRDAQEVESPAAAPPADAGELQRARRELEALRRLLEINRALGSTRDVDELLGVILEAALELTGAERAFLLVRDGDELTTRQARSAGGSQPGNEQLALSRSIATRTMEQGEPLLSTDAEADERLSSFESVHDLKIRSVLAVPLPRSADLNGAIYLDSRLDQRMFTPQHLELVSRLADQAVLALATARMVAQIDDQRQRLDRVNRELQKTLSAQRDELAAAREALSVSRTSLELRYRFEDMIGGSNAMQRVYHLIERLAPKRLPVLVVGESGTGKELIARALHAKSDRSGGPFFTINCAAVSETLLESELFGYRKGAFTGADRDKPGFFELAHGGTLFLDEIGEMGQAMQAKLLGAIERGEVMPVGAKSTTKVDVRIVAATHRDLPAMIKEGAFREDLYYRINVGKIDVPPLRERREDIPLLVDHFLAALADDEQQEKKEIEPAALRRLARCGWPGNVRELQHQILRISAFASGETITLRDLERHGDLPPPAAVEPTDRSAEPGRLESLEELEQRQIRRALEEAGGNKTRAAELLGINRATLFRKLKRFKPEAG